jgi:hypothetical protein
LGIFLVNTSDIPDKSEMTEQNLRREHSAEKSQQQLVNELFELVVRELTGRKRE